MRRIMMVIPCLVLLLLLVAPTAWAGPNHKTWCTYSVKDGDTLYSIAAQFDTTARYLGRVNGIRLARQVYPGQVMRVPCDTADQKVCRAHYTVRADGTMQQIARWHAPSPRNSAWVRGRAIPRRIHAGQWPCTPRRPAVCQ